MNILALEPYYGGSHRAVLDGWVQHSRHRFITLGLPPFHWKWRMRHAAITLAEQVRQRIEGHPDASWDAIFTSDMLSVAELRGLLPQRLRDVPIIVYFHENQITYPVRQEDPRDLHFALTNLSSAVAADAVWFNSAFHRSEFLESAARLLATLPEDPVMKETLPVVAAKSEVQHPGIEPLGRPRTTRPPGPLRIVWAARWEHDKDPESFFAALEELARLAVPFRVSVLGEQFRDVPKIFEQARSWLGERIDHWGYQPSRADYESALRSADLFVSTAQHEFFGLSAVEAMSAGLVPLLPNRLAYPELIERVAPGEDLHATCLYAGDVESLVDRLVRFAAEIDMWDERRSRLAHHTAQWVGWPRRAAIMDDRVDAILAAR